MKIEFQLETFADLAEGDAYYCPVNGRVYMKIEEKGSKCNAVDLETGKLITAPQGQHEEPLRGGLKLMVRREIKC